MKRGFTLLEVLVVLAIIGVVGAAAVTPALSNRDARDLDLTALSISNLIHRARVTALTTGRSVTLRLDVRSGRYWAEVARGDEEPATLYEGIITVPAGVEIQAAHARPRFSFAPQGTATSDSVFLRGAGRRAVVGVDPWTGDPYVHD